MEQLIEVKGLMKVYSDFKVLNNVTFSIEKGETIAIIGGNGSGKSTLLKLVARFSLPSQGSIKRGDQNTRIGYVPEKFPHEIRFTPKDYLYHLGRIQGIPKANLQQKINALLQQFHLVEKQDTIIHTFSKGMKQKVGIMQALMSEPDILILDEPLSGLDLASQQDLEAILYNLKSSDLTIILSCHEKKLLQRVADRVITLKNHQIDRQEYLGGNAKPTIKIEATYKNIDFGFLQQIDGVLQVELNEPAQIVQLEVNPAMSDDLISTLIDKGLSIESVNKNESERSKG